MWRRYKWRAGGNVDYSFACWRRAFLVLGLVNCCLFPAVMASTASRWLRPEAYPIFVATGIAVSMCCFQLGRNLFTNPEVRVTKDNRTAGILENFEEGEKYAQHALRKFVRNKSPEIMPSINKYFTESK